MGGGLSRSTGYVRTRGSSFRARVGLFDLRDRCRQAARVRFRGSGSGTPTSSVLGPGRSVSALAPRRYGLDQLSWFTGTGSSTRATRRRAADERRALLFGLRPVARTPIKVGNIMGAILRPLADRGGLRRLCGDAAVRTRDRLRVHTIRRQVNGVDTALEWSRADALTVRRVRHRLSAAGSGRRLRRIHRFVGWVGSATGLRRQDRLDG
jgi:hypothetical protein